ncbi:MAG: hypothetical protein MUC50_05275 [Myxococcota bacterium]|nr:hypothetical protein [Myxococcota bacterium]
MKMVNNDDFEQKRTEPEALKTKPEGLECPENNENGLKKRPGRRRKGEGPAFPREEVDRLLVHGELKENPDGTGRHTVYPTYRDIAERFGVAHSIIADYAKQHNCLRRRERVHTAVGELTESIFIEERAEALAMDRDGQVRIADLYIAQFKKAILEGRVRTDNLSDYNTVCRLRAFLLGDADSRQQTMNGMPTLEEIQLAHNKLREAKSKLTPATRGEVPLSNYKATKVEGERSDEDDEDDDETSEPGPDTN